MSKKAIAVVMGLIVVAGVSSFYLKRRSVGTEPPTTTAESAPVAASSAPESAPLSRAEDSSALKNRLAEEIRARQRAEAEANALRQTLAPLQSNVVVSFGKVEDMGRRAGAFLPSVGEMDALLSKVPGTLSPEEKRRLLELQRDHAKLLGALPEIARFQDTPDEYGRFFRSMFEQAAGLTEPQAAKVESYMRERAVMMNQLELNAAKEPTDPKLEEAWEERRDKFNEQTAEGLKAALPVGAAEKINFGPELMEFLEMDFDKLTPKPVEKTP